MPRTCPGLGTDGQSSATRATTKTSSSPSCRGSTSASTTHSRPQAGFGEVQRQVRYHYQWIVLNDFLPTIVSKDVLADIVPHISKGTDVLSDPPVLDYYKVRNEAYMPLEFSAAAYRFGHSMVRPGYRLSETIGPLPIFAAQPNAGLTGFHALPA